MSTNFAVISSFMLFLYFSIFVTLETVYYMLFFPKPFIMVDFGLQQNVWAVMQYYNIFNSYSKQPSIHNNCVIFLHENAKSRTVNIFIC